MTLSMTQFRKIKSDEGFVRLNADESLEVVTKKRTAFGRSVEHRSETHHAPDNIQLKQAFVNLIRNEFGGAAYNLALAKIDCHSGKPLTVRQIREFIRIGDAQRLTDSSAERLVKSKTRLHPVSVPHGNGQMQTIQTSLGSTSELEARARASRAPLGLEGSGKHVFAQAAEATNNDAAGDPLRIAQAQQENAGAIQQAFVRHGDGAMRFLSACLTDATYRLADIERMYKSPELVSLYAQKMTEFARANPALMQSTQGSGRPDTDMSTLRVTLPNYVLRLAMLLNAMKEKASKLAAAAPGSEDAQLKEVQLSRSADEIVSCIGSRILNLEAQTMTLNHPEFVMAAGSEHGDTLGLVSEQLSSLHDAYTQPDGPVQTLLALAISVRANPVANAHLLQ
jgi:hypothetical protein